MIDENHLPIASGSYTWENDLVDGVWTYPLEKAVAGIRACYSDLKRDVMEKFGKPLTTVSAIGISGMMHGYLVLDKDGKQLAPFRTWRNTITAPAARQLMELFQFNIPQRWSIAHLYQAILNGEEHVPQIARITTMETAGEGGPWGMALLAAYMGKKAEGESLEDYLQSKVFGSAKSSCVDPDPAGVAGFQSYIRRFEACLDAEKAAANLK